MRVGRLTKMSFILASRASSDGSDLLGEDGDLWSLLSNGLNVLGRAMGASSVSEVDEGSVLADTAESSRLCDWSLLDLLGVVDKLGKPVSHVPARDLATASV